MPIYYVDYINGSDAGTGVDWANAWKTVTLGATAARIAPGDEIRIAKSPDPTSLGSATWVDDTDNIVLASALTKSVVDGGETWTPSANVTFALDTERKIGTNGSKNTFAAGFTTGLASFYALGGVEDFSGYEQISIQVYTSVAIAANTLSIRLCSDVAGVTTVNTIAIPATPETGKFHTFTIDTGGILGSSIQSIALYADLDPGTPQFQMGQIIACKASSDANSLTLSSLVGKGDATSVKWYPIRGIIGDTVYFDYSNTKANYDRGKCNETSEAVVTYKREAIATVPTASPSYSDFTINESGSHLLQTVYSGGWNTGTTTQDGMSFFNGQNGEGKGLNAATKTRYMISNCGFTRYDSNASTNSSGVTIYNCSFTGLADEALSVSPADELLIENCFTFGSIDIFMTGGGFIRFLNHRESGCASGLYASGVRRLEVVDCIFTNNFTNDANITSGTKLLFKNSTADIVGIANGAAAYWQNRDGVSDNHYQQFTEGSIFSQITDRHTESGIAWELEPIATVSYGKYRPLMFKIADVLAQTGVSKTCSVYVKKSHATNISAKLIILEAEIAGVAADVEDVKADDTDWEQLSVTFTPTETGVVSLWVYGWYVSGSASIYVDDFSKS